MDPSEPTESKEAITKRLALQLQIALTAWHELYPEDSDEDACSKSLELVEFDLEELVTRPGWPPSDAPETVGEGEPVEGDVEPVEGAPPAPKPRSSKSFRSILIEVAREHPEGFDIGIAVDSARAKGWSTQANERNMVSVTCSQLVRTGIFARQNVGTYVLAPAFRGEEAPASDED